MRGKLDPIVEGAARDAEAVHEAAQAEERYVADAARLAHEMPGVFFGFCRLLREAVRRFNQAAMPSGRLWWRESAALTSGRLTPNTELHCAFGRQDSEIQLA